MTKASGKLLVQYQLVNGSHFFVGVDGCAETTGLCVGSRDLKKAFDQVGPALTYLLRRNHDITAVCTPKWTFAEFREWLLGQIKKDLVADSSDRGGRFVLRCSRNREIEAVDNSNAGEPGEEERLFRLMPTGISFEDVRAKLFSEGAEPDDMTDVLGRGDHPFAGFRKHVDGRWAFFVVPKCFGPDGYYVPDYVQS